MTYKITDAAAKLLVQKCKISEDDLGFEYLHERGKPITAADRNQMLGSFFDKRGETGKTREHINVDEKAYSALWQSLGYFAYKDPERVEPSLKDRNFDLITLSSFTPRTKSGYKRENFTTIYLLSKSEYDTFSKWQLLKEISNINGEEMSDEDELKRLKGRMKGLKDNLPKRNYESGSEKLLSILRT